MALRRVLHFVFKVGDRAKTATFYRDVLGMKILRHEEFEEGCKATCNGPYDGKWSKTMVGFGPEDDHFVAELTYNYGMGEYQLGNDFLGLTLQSSQAVSNAKRLGWPLTEVGEALYLTQAPGGYPFYLVDKEQPSSVSLDTPGKATVEVVILSDPDGHEICFVGDEAFSQLSMVDPKGNELLDKAMAEDKSDEWFAKHNKQKAAA
ncbi:Glyoxalase domain containing protein 4 [Dissostichus eleginoides]|uniref:Glyoxalase domain containing protein 4 n=1 Tax=Dissostichus eleginoides TaxID=100907 RepID=A0AAD9CEZ7_DISEL|nr:Glyoxalase domain containing protein 4 [Dissostichus eleginoides]